MEEELEDEGVLGSLTTSPEKETKSVPPWGYHLLLLRGIVPLALDPKRARMS